MKNNFYIFMVIGCLVASLSLSAQEGISPCGTEDYLSPWLQEYVKNPNNYARGGGEVLYLPLQIHVVGTDEGNGYMSVKTVLNSFCTLNNDFAASNIQFFMNGPILYIDNTEYYDHDFQAGGQMMNEYNVANAINCYIVEDPAGNCGYFSPSNDGIALNKGCTQPSDHTWAHEVGHFLSLPHPFFGWEYYDDPHDYDDPAPTDFNGWPIEKTDGSNCTEAADLFCDTPPDYLDYRWNCNSDGFSNVVQHDPDTIAFRSDGTYFMSYSNSSCKTRFSDDQTQAMRANVFDERPYLLNAAPTNEYTIPDTEELTVLSPAADEVVEDVQSVTLAWEPIENATHYIVQVNPFNIFSIIFNEFIVEGTSMEFTELESDETYYWRVRPYSALYTCTSFTDVTSFETGGIVATDELLAGEKIQLFPNPVHGDQMTVIFTTQQTDRAEVQLIDPLGQVISTNAMDVYPGNNSLRLDTSTLPAGFYSVRIQLNSRQATRKVLVH